MHVRTLKDLERLVDDGADDDDQPTGARKTMTLKFTAGTGEQGKDAAEIVHMRARKLCFERKQDPTTFAHINAATIEVLNADKALGQAYKELQEACA